MIDSSTALSTAEEPSLPQAIRDAWAEGRRQEAAVLADRLAVAAVERQDGAGLHLAGVVALECQRPDLALDRLEAALSFVREPADGGMLNDHGRACLALGRPVRAEESFRRSVLAAPGLAAARFNLGVARAEQGDLATAIATARHCLLHNPGFVPAYLSLAVWLARQGEVTEAGASLIQAATRWPQRTDIRAQLVELLKTHPLAVPATPEGAAILTALLHHREVDPQELASAGWMWLARDSGSAPLLAHPPTVGEPSVLARALETHALALVLISQALPPNRTIERVLTRLRRWLLLSGQDGSFPALCMALADQCRLNRGAWPITPEEAAERRDRDAHRPIDAAYPPCRSTTGRRPHAHRSQEAAPDDVAVRVQAQYEAHCYPVWRRMTRGPASGFSGFCDRYRETTVRPPRGRPQVLVAGCGTGRQAAHLALAMPDADITAIDVSSTSLLHAKQQARALKLATVCFRQLDLHDVGSLGKVFDHIDCCGVLHHLSDPEAGGRALVSALAPGGTMRIGLYSTLARRGVSMARRHVADLLTNDPGSDDALRLARSSLLSLPSGDPCASVWSFIDFYSLPGFCDLVAHSHEDPFDLSRLARMMNVLGLRFLGFDQLPPDVRARKAALFPALDAEGDHDLASWEAFEKIYPDTFRSMYQFWCRRAGTTHV